MTGRGLRAVACLLLPAAATGCSPDPRAVFDRDVVPVLESTCAASTCHGVAPGAEAAGEVIDRAQLFFDTEEGNLSDLDAAYLSAKAAIDPTEPPAFSSLLRKPLAEAWGGHPHRGGDNFPSVEDPAFVAIAEWIALEPEGGETEAPLDALEQLYADAVQPTLFALSCANAGCHGPAAAIPYHLDAGIGGEQSVRTTRFNYVQSRRMLSLQGDATRSRLLSKALPLHDGGIVHKGGNTTFLRGSDDPRVEPVLEWACREREAATGGGCGDDPSGLVFVRGPVGSGDAFDADRFAPGGDLWFAPWAAPDEAENLTARLHDGPADIRDPAVSPDGTRVAFAMRTTEDAGHALWELDLAGGEARVLVPAPAVGSHRDPVYAPDGSVWFVSTQAGEVAHAGRFLDADLYRLPPDGPVERRTWTPHAERTPTILAVGKVSGEVTFSTLRDTVAHEASGQVFRFPPDLHVEYHIHFGITPEEDALLDLRELPDGRYVLTLGDLTGSRDAGRLAVLDRNFGPEIPDGDDTSASLPFYAAPLVRLDADAGSAGVVARAYRDPVALPDGRVLAAVADGPLDLAGSDPVDWRIELLELREQPDGSGPLIEARETLSDAVGVADFEPRPVYVRWPGTLSVSPPRDDTRGILLYNGLPSVDAILSSIVPEGAKPIVGDRYASVRLVEALPAGPDERVPVAPEETRDGHVGATTTSLAPHPPSRILAELPIAPDGTFQVDAPAGVPFRVQGLDARGMAVGAMHNRWYDLSPGQTIRQGVGHENPRFYGTQCAPCHGALDGDPNNVFIEPDVMTTATVTRSRFERGDPRRPIAPPAVGDATRAAVDFEDDVQPILDGACVECHGVDDALDLRGEPTTWFTESYETLLTLDDEGDHRFVDASTGSARRSPLVERLLGEELDAPGAAPPDGTRHGDLTDEEIAVIARWIDLGASFVGRVGAP